MFSTCANPDCHRGFDYREGHLFRFHKAYPTGERPPNTHAVQHFWLCGNCSANYTLAYERGYGVVIVRRLETAGQPMACRFVAAA
ncbi:MAG: hypothetical protein WA789_16305 [Candidatus Acidiferrum sp.]